MANPIFEHPYRPFYVRDEAQDTLESYERLLDEGRYTELAASINDWVVLPRSLFTIGQLMTLQEHLSEHSIVLDNPCVYFMLR